MFIPVILGTVRKGRASEKVAAFVSAQIKARGFETEIIDPRAYLWGAETVPAWVDDKRITPWQKKAEQASGYVIVIPEYNHGYPGELKLLLDAAYKQYAHKPVALCGVSSGGLGGARVVEHIKPVLVELSMIPLKNAGYFSHAGELFDEEGKPKDPALADRLEAMFEELAYYVNTLQ